MPRHPPCALSIFSYFQLIAIVEDSISTLIYCAMQLSRCSHRDAPRPDGPGSRGTLQTGRCAGTADGTRDTLEPTPLGLPRKEVIQPHLPVRLPCYDFTPLTLHTFGASPPLRVGPATSGADDSGGVTGGVYKTRERIHRGVLIRDY